MNLKYVKGTTINNDVKTELSKSLPANVCSIVCKSKRFKCQSLYFREWNLGFRTYDFVWKNRDIPDVQEWIKQNCN